MSSTIKLGCVIENKYKIIKLIGEGGMSYVYQAKNIEKNIEKNIDVAIKFLKQGITSSYVEDSIRFKREIEAVSKLNHSNIIQLYDSGEYKNTPYLVMELLEGDSLSNLIIQNKKISIDKILKIIKQLAITLNYIHNKKIIHRDIKPNNIIIIKKKDDYIVKLLDFGLALIMELSQIKGDKNIIGTFGYMSPEATGIIKKPIDERSDLYSLGIIFYQLLTGELPFKEKTISTLLHQQVTFNPIPTTTINSDIPQIMDEIVSKLMNKEQGSRYQSAKGLLYDLDLFMSGTKEFVVGSNDQKVKLTYQAKLVGREEELNNIKHLINNAQNNNGNICLIGGEAGVGKTRLVQAIKTDIYYKGGLYLEGCCISQENKIPYQPFKDVINEYIDKVEKMSSDDRNREIKRINKVLGKLGGIINIINPNMKRILGTMPALVQLEPEKQNKRFLTVLSNFFRHMSNNNVCVLFLDDLQWADEGSFKLLEEIRNDISKSNLIIIGTYRNNEINERHNLTKIIKESNEHILKNIQLKNFNKNRLNKLVANILGEREDYAQNLTEYVLKKSGGNPFFSVTILRELVEQNALIWKNGRWEENWKKINKVKILGNIVDMVLLRIKNIPKKLDHFLRLGAIIGKEFEIDLLYQLFEEKKEEVINLIDEAIDRQLIEESTTKKGKVLFIHDRIREAFYNKMTTNDKRTYHLKIAHVIEINKNIQDSNTVFELAHHYIEGHDNIKSLKYALPAAKKAKKNYANNEAIKYYKKSIELLEKLKQKENQEWINANKDLVEIYLITGENDKTIKIINKLLTIIDVPLEKAVLKSKIGKAWLNKGNFKKSEEILIESLKFIKEKFPQNKIILYLSILKEFLTYISSFFLPKFLKKLHTQKENIKYEEITKIHLSLIWIYSLSGDIKYAYSTFRMLNIATFKNINPKYSASALEAYGGLLITLPLFKTAIKNFEKAIKILIKSNDEHGIAENKQLLAFCYSWQGDYRQSIDYAKESLEKFKGIGDVWKMGMSLNALGQAYRYLGEIDKSISCFFQYLEISKNTKDYYGAASAYDDLAISYYHKGKTEEIFKYAKLSLTISKKHKIIFPLFASNKSIGMHYLAINQEKQAVKFFKQAQKIEKNNDLIKEYTVLMYPYLITALINKYKANSHELSDKEKKVELKKIKKICFKTLKLSNTWINHKANTLMVLANYYLLINKYHKAKNFFEKSLEQSKKLGLRYDEGIAYYKYGCYFSLIKQIEKAKEQWRNAYNIFEDIKETKYLEECSNLLGYKNKQTENESINPQDRLTIERRMTTVLNTSRYLSSILNFNELLEKIMDRTIELVGAKRGILFLCLEKNKEQNLEVKTIRNIKNKETEILTIKETVIPIVLKEKKPLIISDASTINATFNSRPSSTSSPSSYNSKSILCAPIITKNELLGIIYLDNHLVTNLFSEEDLKALELIAGQAGVSIENAKLYQNIQEQERLKQEMEIAERIQTAIVPSPPIHEELEITAFMQPAEEVGGDYYDILFDKHNNIWFAIGDVSGHGVTSGLIMMMAQAALATTIDDRNNITPKDAMVKVNRLLFQNIRTRLKESHFMTMNFLKYMGNGNFTHSGSHLDIIVYRNKTKECELIKTDGIFLGLVPDVSKALLNKTFTLNKNDIMLLYTDGIIEARDTNRDLMGMKIVQDILIENSEKELEEIKNSILKKTLDWCKNKPDDDITMVVIKKK